MGEVTPMRKGGLTPTDLLRQKRAAQRAQTRQNKADLAAWRALSYAAKVKYYRQKGVVI
jgi:hypothetical protein